MTSTLAISGAAAAIVPGSVELEIARIAKEIADCGNCHFRDEPEPSKRRLCGRHRQILPRKIRSSLAQVTGNQYTPGAASPSLARATLTRKARLAKRRRQMEARSGYLGLARAVEALR